MNNTPNRLLALLLTGCTLGAQANDVFCLQSPGRGKPIQLQMTLFRGTQGGWSQAGEVQYRGQPNGLPIVFKSSEAVKDVVGRPSVYRSTWLEVLPKTEKIGGRYQFYHQGAVVSAFSYSNYRSGKRFEFEERPELRNEAGGCVWPE